jgi:hypothetical protein
MLEDLEQLRAELVAVRVDLVTAQTAAAVSARELEEARKELGTGWLAGDVSLAQGISRKFAVFVATEEQLMRRRAQEQREMAVLVEEHEKALAKAVASACAGAVLRESGLGDLVKHQVAASVMRAGTTVRR